MNGKRIAIVGGLVGLGLLFASRAKAADIVGPIFPVRPPVRPDPIGPVDPGFVEPPVEPPPPPPNPLKKNYVGSGYDWPRRDRFPNEGSFSYYLGMMGYPVLAPFAGFSPISASTMTQVRRFQRDYNKVRVTSENPNPGIAEDGLIGKGTIAAMIAAEAWKIVAGIPWLQLVALA